MAKQTTSGSTTPMSFGKLVLYIVLTLIGFWFLGLVFDLAKWVLEIALVVGLVIVILALVNEYWSGKQRIKR